MTLLELAEACERATGPDKALNREIALAIGWHRYTPSEIRRSNPGWIAPEDFIGETVGKDGRKSPILDGMHGTEIWREPRDYTGSLDAAMQLVPEGYDWIIGDVNGYYGGTPYACVGNLTEHYGRTAVLALCVAALRARHAMESE